MQAKKKKNIKHTITEDSQRQSDSIKTILFKADRVFAPWPAGAKLLPVRGETDCSFF